MRPRSQLLPVLATLLAACSSAPARPDSSASTPATPASPAATTPAQSSSSPGAAPAADLDATILVERTAAGAVPVLQQRGRTPARIAAALLLERRHGSAWQTVSDAQLSLRYDCESPVAPCLELLPGAELHPPAWPGRLGASQCGCPTCAAAPAGEYRFVARGCDGGPRVESPGFNVP